MSLGYLLFNHWFRTIQNIVNIASLGLTRLDGPIVERMRMGLF